MESSSKNDKNTVIDKKVKTPETTVKANAEKQKNTSEKTRSGFWSRLKHFTIEPRKTVVIENGVEKLVLIPPEITAIPKTVFPKEETQKSVSVSPETIIRTEIVVKPTPVSQEAIVREKPIEKPLSVPPKTTVVKEKVERKPLPSSEKLKKGLEKTRGRFWSRLRDFFSFRRKIDESVLEELEDILIGADIGAKPVKKLIHELHEAWKSQTITETSQIHDFIKNKLKEDLRSWQTSIHYAPNPPTVIMVVGVNGVGKTTAIAKLANILIKDGKKVLVAAGDTFRAAAVDQLDIWSKRIGAEIVKHQTGSGPAAVAYDAIEASIARGIHVVIVDTAGRLHTHENLMSELSKIKRVISKRIPCAPHEVYDGARRHNWTKCDLPGKD